MEDRSNSENLLGWFTFGSNTRQAWEINLGILWPQKNSCIMLKRSSLMISQLEWKIMPLIPSVTAAELALIDQIAYFSSSFVGMAWSFWFWYSVIVLGMHLRTSSLIRLSSPVKIFSKRQHAALKIFSSPLIVLPWSSLILWINNLLLLPLIIACKYLVFASPSLNHCSWVFCLRVDCSIFKYLMHEH